MTLTIQSAWDVSDDFIALAFQAVVAAVDQPKAGAVVLLLGAAMRRVWASHYGSQIKSVASAKFSFQEKLTK